MIDATTAVLLAFATYRVTRLVVEDSITEPVRGRVMAALARRASSRWAAWLADLLECPWCVSVWVAGAFVAAVASTGATGAAWGWSGVVTLGVAWMATAGGAVAVWAAVER